MGLLVGTGSLAKCTFGAASTPLIATPASKVMVEGVPAVTFLDIAPGANITPFGVCKTVSNPTVASATAAAAGVLTPMPCIPVVTGPWQATSPTNNAGSKPFVTSTSMCMCAWGGVITIDMPSAKRTNGKP